MVALSWLRHRYLRKSFGLHAFALADNSERKRQIGPSIPLFLDGKSFAASLRYIKTIRAAIGGEEDVVRICFDYSRKITGDFYLRFALDELGLAEILEPAFRTLHAIKLSMRAVREWSGDASAAS